MPYSQKVLEHYENPKNVGTLDKNDPNVGTGLVGAPACGDVMRLQIKVNDQGVIEDARFKTFGCVASNVPIASPQGYTKAGCVKVGQEVYAWTGSNISTATVTNVVTRSVSMTDLLKIDFGFRHPVVVGRDHIFVKVGGSPVEAEDLADADLFEILEPELRGLNNVGQRPWLREVNRVRLKEHNPMLDQEVVSRANNAEHQSRRIQLSLDSKPETPYERRFRERFGHLPLEFIGDGKAVVGGKCADFVVSGTRKIIDLTSDVSWRLSRRDSNYEVSRRAIFEGSGFSYFHFIEKVTPPEDLERFVHNGISAKSVEKITDKRGLRGLERDPMDSSRVILYDFELSGPHTYFVYRVASHNCGSAIASSSLATEWIKGKTVDEAEAIKNSQIVEELNLPPVKIHCSVLAEDAIKSAIADYRKKRQSAGALPV